MADLFQSITFQQPYQSKSFEELRVEDYLHGRCHDNDDDQARRSGRSTSVSDTDIMPSLPDNGGSKRPSAFHLVELFILADKINIAPLRAQVLSSFQETLTGIDDGLSYPAELDSLVRHVYITHRRDAVWLRSHLVSRLKQLLPSIKDDVPLQTLLNDVPGLGYELLRSTVSTSSLFGPASAGIFGGLICSDSAATKTSATTTVVSVTGTPDHDEKAAGNFDTPAKISVAQNLIPTSSTCTSPSADVPFQAPIDLRADTLSVSKLSSLIVDEPTARQLVQMNSHVKAVLESLVSPLEKQTAKLKETIAERDAEVKKLKEALGTANARDSTEPIAVRAADSTEQKDTVTSLFSNPAASMSSNFPRFGAVTRSHVTYGTPPASTETQTQSLSGRGGFSPSFTRACSTGLPRGELSRDANAPLSGGCPRGGSSKAGSGPFGSPRDEYASGMKTKAAKNESGPSFATTAPPTPTSSEAAGQASKVKISQTAGKPTQSLFGASKPGYKREVWGGPRGVSQASGLKRKANETAPSPSTSGEVAGQLRTAKLPRTDAGGFGPGKPSLFRGAE